MEMKKTTPTDKYYAFTLDDYATVSFVSASKTYFGTLDDFARLFVGNSNEGLKAPFEAFKKGDKEVLCDVAYNKAKFATRVKVLDVKEIETGKGKYDHDNIYGFPYNMHFNKKVETRYLIKYGKLFYVAYRLQVENLTYEDEFKKSGLSPIDRFWGFPCMIQKISGKGKKTIYENVLLEYTDEYKTRNKAEEVFYSDEPLDYKEFFNDVFGDG